MGARPATIFVGLLAGSCTAHPDTDAMSPWLPPSSPPDSYATAASLPRPRAAWPSHSRVPVYHRLQNEDAGYDARWLYATLNSTASNIFFDLGRSFVARTHQDVNDAFDATCHCTVDDPCSMPAEHFDAYRRSVQDMFQTDACPLVHPRAIFNARAAGYDSIQITAHRLDSARFPSIESKFEIIDLSPYRSNWLSGFVLPRYFDRRGAGCRVTSRLLVGLEHMYFPASTRLLGCLGDTASPDVFRPSLRQTPPTCERVRKSIRPVRLESSSTTCWAAERGPYAGEAVPKGVRVGTLLQCNPMSPGAFASHECAFRVAMSCPVIDSRSGSSSCGNFKSCTAPPRYGTCALVSSAGVLRESDCGEEIDSHDAVWRMNVPPTAGYEGDVGSRTDIDVVMSWVARALVGPMAPGYDEVEEVLEYMSDPLNATRLVMAVPESHPPRPLNFAGAAALRSGGSEDLCPSLLSLGDDRRRELGVGGLMDANPHINNAFEAQVAHFFPDDWIASTGLRSAVLALTMCDEVTLYGFQEQPNGTRYHYWDPASFADLSADADMREEHQMAMEHALIASLASLDHVPLCDGPEPTKKADKKSGPKKPRKKSYLTPQAQ